jgi:cullin-associated NEDD8-dissociated protein 1
VRNVAAECLGKLCVSAPGSVIPALEQRLGTSSGLTRSVVVNSMRYMPLDAMSPASILKFLSKIEDDDLKVRRAALLARRVPRLHRLAAWHLIS